MKNIFTALLVLVLAGGMFSIYRYEKNQQNMPIAAKGKAAPGTKTSPTPSVTPSASISPTATTLPSPSPTAATATKIGEPISGGLSRVSKKPFGLYVTPKNSPVQPEKFIGYHTGVDFETTPGEQNQDVAIHALCDGPLVMKKWATGYGGVAVQSCTINNQAVTIIYGHLNISSVVATGKALQTGDVIGLLGKGYSQETDGERKHLHLGIHKGAVINILGYVQDKNLLQNWIDAGILLK